MKYLGSISDSKDLVNKGYVDDSIEAGLEAVFKWLGVTTTSITDGSSTNPITINNESVTAVEGSVVGYNNSEFLFDGSNWKELGKDEPIAFESFSGPSSVSTATTFTYGSYTYYKGYKGSVISAFPHYTGSSFRLEMESSIPTVPPTINTYDGYYVSYSSGGTTYPVICAGTGDESSITSYPLYLIVITTESGSKYYTIYSRSSNNTIPAWTLYEENKNKEIIIEQELKEGSTNLVTNGAVAKSVNGLNEEVGDLKSVLTDFYKHGLIYFPLGSFTQGNLNADGSINAGVENAIYTSDYVAFSDDCTLQIPYGYRCRVKAYNKGTKAFVTSIATDVQKSVSIPYNANYVYRIAEQHSNGTTAILPGEANLVAFLTGSYVYAPIKNIVTPIEFGAKGDGLTDDTNAFTAFVTYCESHECYPLIPTATYKANISLSARSKEYHFNRSIIIGTLNIIGGDTIKVHDAIIQNTTDSCVKISSANTITFFNCMFVGGTANKPQVYFGEDTWGCKFSNCAFTSQTALKSIFNGHTESHDGSKTVCGTLLLDNCHGYNFQSIKYCEASSGGSMSIVGGYYDAIDFVLLTESAYNGNIELSGVDLEHKIAISYVKGYANMNVGLSSCFGSINTLSYHLNGNVNISVYGFGWQSDIAELVPDYCKDPANNVYVSLNGIKNKQLTEYRVEGRFLKYTRTVKVPPKTMMKVMDKVYVLNLDKNSEVNTGIKFYYENGEYSHTDAYLYNMIGDIFIYNENDEAKTVVFALTTKCFLGDDFEIVT